MGGAAGKEIPFSYIERAEKASFAGEKSADIMGFAVHFSQKVNNIPSNDVEKCNELLDSAGVGWIRDEYSWSKVELEKGKYTFPEYLDEYVDRAKKSGREILICLDYGNPLYDGGGAPYTDEGRRAFANYAKAVAEHLKGKVTHFEIWNEWSGGFGNPKKHSAAVYAELLKVVYPALKEIDPNITVIAGATHNEGLLWFKEMYDNGGYENCDAISYHPYSYPTAPDVWNYQGNIFQNSQRHKNLMREYGEEKPIWITEIGYPSAKQFANGVREQDQKNFIIRAYIQGMAYGVDKIFVYDFQNDGVNPSDREANFGVILNKSEVLDVPYAAKPSYAALGVLNNKLAGMECVAEYMPNYSTRIYCFQNKETNEETAVLWSIYGSSEISVTGNTAEMTAYDVFGNVCGLKEITGEPVYLVGECGQFDFRNIILPKWLETSVSTSDRGISLENGIKVNGIPSFADYEGVTYWQVKDNASIVYNVDDTYIYGGAKPVELSVTYLDEGEGSIWAEYKGFGGEVLQTEKVYLSGTGQWKTKELFIEDGVFENGLKEGDFEFKSDGSVILSKATFSITSKQAPSEVSFSFDGEGEYGYMTVWGSSNDSFFDKTVEREGRKGWMSNKAIASMYIICDIDDKVIYGGENKIRIEVDYFDEGDGSFCISYASANGNRFYPTDSVRLEDSGQWKTAVFDIDDAVCANTTNNGDFRIALWSEKMGTSAADVIFGRVSVKTEEAINAENENEKIFEDIESHWAKEDISALAETNSVSGYSDGKFMPDENISVEEFTKILIDILKFPIEKSSGAWSEPYIKKAAETGIIKSGEFKDYSKNITRDEIARMIERAFAKSDSDTDYISKACEDEFIFGYENGELYPENNATRAEAAVILNRFLNRL